MTSEPTRRLRSLAGRAKRRALEPARRRAHDAEQRDLILRSGLFDQEWVEEQLGRSFASVEEALDAYLGAGECTPHPLFFGQWIELPVAAPAPGEDPLVWYLRTKRVHRRHSPHPLVDLAKLPGKYADHEFGPVAGWVADLTPDTPMPLPDGLPPLTWGQLRETNRELAREWHAGVERRTFRRRSKVAPETVAEPTGPAGSAGADGPLVSVVMPMWNRGAVVRRAIESVQAQTWGSWELLVVDDGSTDDGPSVVRGMASFDPRIRFVAAPHRGVSATRNAGIAEANGRYLAFLDTDNVWLPGFLQVMVEHLEARGWEMAHSALRATGGGQTYYRGSEGTREDLLGGNFVDLNVLVARAEVVREVDGFDEGLRRGVDYDLILKLADRYPTHLVPYIGVDYDDDEGKKPVRPRLWEGDTVKRAVGSNRISTTESSNWLDVIRTRHLTHWDETASAARTPGLTSVVIPMKGVMRPAVDSLLALADQDDLEVVMVCPPRSRWRNLLLRVVASATRNARVVNQPTLWSDTARANYGLVHTTGETVLLALDQISVAPATVRALAARLAEEDVAVVQPVLVTASGEVDAAGAVFAPRSARPQPFLRGHAVRDATRVDALELPAAYGRAVAVRAADLIAAGALDALVGDELTVTDLSLRLAASGRTVLAPDAVVTVGRPSVDGAALATDVGVFEERHRPPAGSPACWEAAGFEVVSHATELVATSGREDPTPRPDDQPLLLPRAVVRPLRITEGAPSLRWTIDLASPAGPVGETWGDTHFGDALARALERLGQRVAVDNRTLRHRGSRDFDDVLLVLRGLDAVRPRPGCLNLEWVISHPELVTATEIASFDRVYAASASWPEQIGRDWGVEVHSLLQATDPERFHPEPAVFDTGAEVLFVGNARRIHRPAVRHAVGIGAALEVHGRGWDGLVDRKHVRSAYVDNADLAGLYAGAGVVLNDHWEDMRQLGFVSNRIMDAAAAGARVASDVVPGADLTAMFHGLVQTWDSEADLAQILAERETLFPDADGRVAAAARVAEEHSFDARARTLLDDAVRLLAQRDD